MGIGFLSGFLTGLLGWQINLIAIHRGMEIRKREAFLVGIGAIVADLIWIGAAFAGARSLLASHREYWNHVKWLGILMVTFAGLRIFFHDPKKTQKEPNPGNWVHAKSFLMGFFVVLGNPALLVLWVGVISFVLTHLFPENPQQGLHFFYMGGFAMGASMWFMLLTLAILPRVRQWTDERFHLISKFFAGALLIAAGCLIFKKF